MYEFHIASHIRRLFNFSESLFELSGNIAFANFFQVRSFVFEYNKEKQDSQKINPGSVNAAGLLDEIFHFVVSSYSKEINPGSTSKAVQHLENVFSKEKLYDLVFDFTSIFQPKSVYQNAVSVKDYLQSTTDGKNNFEIALEELILLHFDNYNKANKNLKELIDENYLSNKEFYSVVITELDRFFETQPKFHHVDQTLFKMLRTPLDLHPDDIEAQLNFIQEKWGVIIGDEFIKKLLKSQDFIKENRVIEMGWGGPVPTVVPRYKGDADFSDTIVGKSAFDYGRESLSDYEEIEKFTPDIDWMPRVVLMAKNIYVWLDQLSKKYERHIHRLDQIPNEEIDQLVQWGFTGLWLIGLWERSGASKKIKHIMGNIDAVASAYSLYDYEIAHDLGGDEAYDNFNRRAKERGLRLASDMVPNHTGIFSRWVIDNPHFFIQSDYPPFPNYTFTGTDLSDDPTVQLRIEDGYWERRDAAVVFQRIDNRNGEIKYLYHGNDGTNMPWNDTAQLNMLSFEVREAVIQKIFDVARRFSIIRFDAAMTLTKRHFSRLWYPQPGTGGDIPSRADYAMTKSEFDSQFPHEFWREVVDRINDTMPETLLLAEAFWLMEGYFVRSLGMHRVYNSAFMNMMMREENEKYRDLITNTLEFEPEILKRYVNFMSNPDEETAIKQFGTDDKYFGVLMMMITLPGLPMFGHGQIEGFTEKYGMEYQRAYYNETPKQWLVERHIKEVFPVMKRRFMFAGVEDFWMFDFLDSFGNINENVFAYINGFDNEKALVIYNNKYEGAHGTVKYSTSKLVSSEDGKTGRTISLAGALNLDNNENVYYSYREHISGKEYLVTGKEIHDSGFTYHLNGFEYRLFWNFQKLGEDTEILRKVRNQIGVYGSNNLKEQIVRAKFEYIYNQVKKVFSNCLNTLSDIEINNDEINKKIPAIKESYNTLVSYIHGALGFEVQSCRIEFSDQIKAAGEILRELNAKENRVSSLQNVLKGNRKDNNQFLTAIFLLISLKNVFGEKFREVFTSLHLNYPLRDILHESGKGELYVRRKEVILFELIKHCKLLEFCKGKSEEKESKGSEQILSELLLSLLEEENIKNYLQVNEYKGIRYYSKESFEEFVLEMILLVMIRTHLQDSLLTDKKPELSVEEKIKIRLSESEKIFRYLLMLSENCEYIYDKLVDSELKIEEL